MGIFGRNIDKAYGPQSTLTIAVASPWTPTDNLTQLAFDELFKGPDSASIPMTREIALRIPGVKRAHQIHVKQFAGLAFNAMVNDQIAPTQPAWLTSSASGVSPFHRMHGVGSDLFFNGWACLGFDRSPLDADADCIHVPFGLWGIDPETGRPWIDGKQLGAMARFAAYPVVISAGYGDNGLLVDGIDTLREARQIEDAYKRRLDDPVPLTILNIPRDAWEGMTPEERASYREQWVDGRRKSSTALKVAEWPVEMPGQVAVDLYETGRNAVRLDIANHTGTPASLLEGTRQAGGGGTDVRYTGVANGAMRGELWEFGSARGFTLAFEARMSLDDIVPSGQSIRADLTSINAIPAPDTNPPRED
ncbi:hypothetical protein IC744_13990 [Microbacterium hominis]|nr:MULTISPECIES: hypothetical protein [Microbacterium]QOC28469.1 hypothetical protein IC744_13990 [Microbacterium hominis]QYF96328.1 hypothetical protein KY498_08915 [Microbacterium sp. PAMC21962]